MPRLAPLALVLVLVPVLAAAAALATPQVRTQQKGPADFEATLTATREAWNQARYGACLEHLREATGLVTTKRIDAILAALPAAPAGFEAVPRRDDQVQQNQMLGGMAAMVGSLVEQEYRGPHRIQVTVSADSPMVSMLTMSMNPAYLDKDSELIEYEGGKALLKKTSGGSSRELTIVIADKHMVQIDFGGADEDLLFGMWNQAAVDQLTAALEN